MGAWEHPEISSPLHRCARGPGDSRHFHLALVLCPPSLAAGGTSLSLVGWGETDGFAGINCSELWTKTDFSWFQNNEYQGMMRSYENPNGGMAALANYAAGEWVDCGILGSSIFVTIYQTYCGQDGYAGKVKITKCWEYSDMTRTTSSFVTAAPEISAANSSDPEQRRVRRLGCIIGADNVRSQLAGACLLLCSFLLFE